MSIESNIENWDGKSSADIDAIYDRHFNSKDFLADIILLIGKESLQSGASWLLKRYFEDGRTVDSEQASNILSQLNDLKTWAAKLHILQCLSEIPIAGDRKGDVERFLRTSLSSENKFVRAWTYNGFYILCNQYPEYKQETKEFFDMAMRDEAPSVRARIRNIVKAGF